MTSGVATQSETVSRYLADLSPVPSPPPPPSTTVSQVLSDIRDLYQGFNPGLFQEWFLENTTECSFPGVECDSGGSITGLSLVNVIPQNTTDQPVIGAIEAIEQLISLAPSLRVLVLTGGNMAGEIPSVWPPNLEVSFWEGTENNDYSFFYRRGALIGILKENGGSGDDVAYSEALFVVCMCRF